MQTELTGTATAAALRIVAGQATPVDEQLAQETAIALVYNGISHAVMMCTPLDLEDFALGFSLSEGVITQPFEMKGVEISAAARGITVDIEITEARFQALKDVRRSLVGRTGCGLCGVDSLDAAMRPIAQVNNTTTVSSTDIQAALARLAELQPLNRATGAVHAAGLWQRGEMTVREDVGRHNALDKLIGATARTGRQHGVLVMTSRASYEIVYKAASAGIEIVAAISAPTSLAVELAEQAGITLIGFARDDRLTAYSYPSRIAA
ncbi:MAG: formate dehydrogenase accessory sulfurtransferase FdhD [Burkholderiales bacterium]|nr:formate dehydrogenase accessory sulfurtransferase FdhD [Burkholderiales bacterium]